MVHARRAYALSSARVVEPIARETSHHHRRLSRPRIERIVRVVVVVVVVVVVPPPPTPIARVVDGRWRRRRR